MMFPRRFLDIKWNNYVPGVLIIVILLTIIPLTQSRAQDPQQNEVMTGIFPRMFGTPLTIKSIYLGVHRQCYSPRLIDVRRDELLFVREKPWNYNYTCQQHFCRVNITAEPTFIVLDCYLDAIVNQSCTVESLEVTIDLVNSYTICGGYTGPTKWAGEFVSLRYERKIDENFGGYFCSLLGKNATDASSALTAREKLEISSTEDNRLRSTADLQESLHCNNCGQSKFDKNRIVGGQEARKNNYPWMVLLSIENSRGQVHTCGGTLISRRDVLTAAHCIDKKIKKILVKMGFHDLSTTLSETVTDRTTEYLVHPTFFETGFTGNDIALVFLSKPIRDFSEYIAPACLPGPDIGYLVGVEVNAIGWGTKSVTGSVSSTLQEVNITVVTNSECSGFYSQHQVEILDSHLCTYDLGKDACLGDSGGPLQIKIDNHWIVVGIISFSFDCALPDVPGVNTRVSEFNQWIQENMKDPCDL